VTRSNYKAFINSFTLLLTATHMKSSQCVMSSPVVARQRTPSMSSSAHVVIKQRTISFGYIIHALRCHVNMYSVASSYVQLKIVLHLCSEYLTLPHFTYGLSDSYEILLSYVNSVEEQNGTCRPCRLSSYRLQVQRTDNYKKLSESGLFNFIFDLKSWVCLHVKK
jgi:hypothetical protein